MAPEKLDEEALHVFQVAGEHLPSHLGSLGSPDVRGRCGEAFAAGLYEPGSL